MADRGGVRSQVLGLRVLPRVPRPADVILPIADRPHASGAPAAGWCAESAIQQALLHFGAWVPQKLVNRAGRPTTPDLYARDLPVALRHLGVRFHRWPWKRQGFAPYRKWVESAIRAGDPVLVGVKILPTQHPRWGLDHFVLAVGLGARGLLVNTTWGRSQWLSAEQMAHGKRGLSFRNRYDRYFGLRLQGLRSHPRGEPPVGLRVTREDRARVTLLAQCTGLTRGGVYVLEQRGHRRDRRPVRSVRFTAAGTAHTRHVTVRRDRAAWFRCRPVGGAARPATRTAEVPDLGRG